jgi:cysteine-rich repeat protein
MEKSLAGIAVVMFAGLGLCGCKNGGQQLNPPTDASVGAPDVPPDISRDVGVVIVNLPDVAIANETAGAKCGNGILEGAEECDDGNTVSGEGCTSDCKLESDWICPTPGSPCISTVVCGDKRISGAEACDDGNTIDNDGCSADCSAINPGWVCLAPGVRCQPKCGDGILTGWEQCDDGNTVAGDGCSAACTVETGYACPTAGSPCHGTVCGDGV